MTFTKLAIIFTLSAIFFAALIPAQAQESSVATDVGATIKSRHYWRGIPVSSAPVFASSLSLSSGQFTIGFWGGYAFDNTYSEFDIFASYSVGGFSVSVTDLYVYNDYLANNNNHRYFNFDQKTTLHNFDATLAYQLQGSFPLKIAASTMLWGADRDVDGDQRYSSYVELSYPLEINEENTLNFFMGTSLLDKANAYGNGFGVVNAGVTGFRKVPITENYSLPLTATVAFNPQAEYGYLIFTVSL